MDTSHNLVPSDNCPNCGYCKSCGRSNYPKDNYYPLNPWYQPYVSPYPAYPGQITWTSSNAGNLPVGEQLEFRFPA